MDSITHLFLGGAIAAAMAPAKYRRSAILAGAAINSLPDLDVIPLFAFSDDPLIQLTWHRAATHSLLVLPWVAAALWWLLKSRWAPVREEPRRWFWLILVTLLANCDTVTSIMQDSTGGFLARLERSAQTGRLDGLEIEYWVGGGLPPPYYRSDQFRVLTVQGRDTLEFARPLWDDAFKPPQLVEKFQRPATTADVRRVARLILDAGVFTEQHEEKPRVGDGLSTEVILTAGGTKKQSVYRGNVPPKLRALEADVERLRLTLEREGARSVLHQGTPLVPPPPPRDRK